jgi:branched-chain amino acid transport system ATP-binding protein
VSTPAFLSMDGLTHAFDGVTAVDSVTLRLRPGETTGLIGPNGAGKTTLFNLVSGFLRPRSGTVWWRGQDITAMSMPRRARLGLVRTFQHVHTFPALSVEENFAVARAAARLTGRVPRPDAEVLELMKLGPLRGRAAGALPYGSARKLSLGLALTLRPELLMLDEPAAGLTAADVTDLTETIAALRADGVTIWVVEHDMSFVAACCERVIVLAAGRVLADARPSRIRENPLVIDAYLGSEARR